MSCNRRDVDSLRNRSELAAVELGRLGGKKGGKVRAARMTEAEKKERAAKDAATRWKKKYPET
jgi:hypothetical protein